MPIGLTRYELYALDGSYYSHVYPRESDRRTWVTVPRNPPDGVPMVDSHGRQLVEYHGRLFRSMLNT